MASRCTATRRDGRPCEGPATADGLCFAHSPALRAKTAQARREGGRNSGTARRVERKAPEELRGVGKLLTTAMVNVYHGNFPPQRAHALAALAGAWLRYYEVGEVEVRMADLEAELGGERRA